MHKCMNGLVLVSDPNEVAFIEVWRPCDEHNPQAYARWLEGKFQLRRPAPTMPMDYQGEY